MSSIGIDVVKTMLNNKKFDVVTECATIQHGSERKIIINEYAGKDVRLFKNDNGDVTVLYPKTADVVMEGHVAQAITNGTIFDDADEADNNAEMITRTALPYAAMINSGKNEPNTIKKVVCIVLSKMDDDGRCCVSDADRDNGINFIKDITDTRRNDGDTRDVIDNYIDKPSDEFYGPGVGSKIVQLNKEVDDVNDTPYEEIIDKDTDTVDDYDDYDMNSFEKDNDESVPTIEPDDDDEGVKLTDTDSDDKDDDNEEKDSGVSDDDGSDGENSMDDHSYGSDDDSDELSDDSNDDNSDSSDDDTEDDESDDSDDSEDDDKKDDEEDSEDDDDDKGVKLDETHSDDEDEEPVEEGAVTTDASNTGSNPMTSAVMPGPIATLESKTPDEIDRERYKKYQEGFLTKKPKKLKPIGRDVVAYITVMINDIHSSNDQAMLAGYTCSKLELVDFYITALDTQDARYIVPHTRQYLATIKNDLEILLARILKIRPVNRSEQIWRVNYPTE